MAESFSGGGAASKTASAAEIATLHAKIGELVVERDVARAYASPLG